MWLNHRSNSGIDYLFLHQNFEIPTESHLSICNDGYSVYQYDITMDCRPDWNNRRYFAIRYQDSEILMGDNLTRLLIDMFTSWNSQPRVAVHYHNVVRIR